jgi:AbrB family looped-hinge helix DNA binding protein
MNSRVVEVGEGGRVVLPSAVRRALGIARGTQLEVDVDPDRGSVTLRPAALPVRIDRKGKRPRLVPMVDVPPLTDDIVRSTMDSIRR